MLWELRSSSRCCMHIKGTAEVKRRLHEKCTPSFSDCLTEVVSRCLQLGLRLFTLHAVCRLRKGCRQGWKGKNKNGKRERSPLSSFSFPFPYSFLSLPRFSSPSSPFLRLAVKDNSDKGQVTVRMYWRESFSGPEFKVLINLKEARLSGCHHHSHGVL